MSGGGHDVYGPTNEELRKARVMEKEAESKEPKIGDFCLCSRNEIGIITQDERKEITYPDGNKGQAYVGIKLDGSPWSSRTPKIVGSLSTSGLAALTILLAGFKVLDQRLARLEDVVFQKLGL